MTQEQFDTVIKAADTAIPNDEQFSSFLYQWLKLLVVEQPVKKD